MDRQLEKKKWSKKKVLTYSLIIVFIVVIYIFLSVKGASLNVEKKRITISNVTQGSFLEYIPIICTVHPKNTIFLNAVEGGRVETVYLEAGTKVKQGDKILKLSNTNLLMTLLNNEAQINRAGNDLRTTRLQLEQNRLSLEKDRELVEYELEKITKKHERSKALYEEGMISKQEYEDDKREFEYLTRKKKLTLEAQQKDLSFREQQVSSLELSVKRMEETLVIAKQQYDNLTIVAPIAGQLTSLNAEKGQSKNPGEAMGQIDEVNGFKLRSEIDEHYLNRIEVGKVGEFDFNDKVYKVKVTKIFPEVKDGKFQIEAIFEKTVPDGITRGQSLHVRLQLSEASQALLLPRGSFYQTTGGNWAFVLDESGKSATKRLIRLGRQNPQSLEVLGGLKIGEKVITSSYENYKDKENLSLE